jgi:hypothetical protein
LGLFCAARKKSVLSFEDSQAEISVLSFQNLKFEISVLSFQK